MKRGLLVLIGGAEDRKGSKFVLKDLLDHTKASSVVIIPTASAYPKDIHRDYENAFRDLGLRSIDCLDIRYKDEADRAENLRAVEEADLIFFGGGDQVKLVDTLRRTEFFKRISDRFERGALHIAGTSAGAAAAGNPMIYDGNRKGFHKGSIGFKDGFGFVSGVAIDTHFSARRRLARLSQFLISGNCQKGIGLDENTGIIVYPNYHFKVIGSGMVTVLNSVNVSGSNYNAVPKGERLRFNNMRIGFLPAGTMFSIKKWSIIHRVRSTYLPA